MNEQKEHEDYRDADGLLVCGKCGKRKEHRLPAIPALGKEARTVHVPCECVERERREREEQERRYRAERLAEKRREECFRNSGFFRDCSFLTAIQTDIATVANVMESSFERRRANLDRILGTDLLLIEDLGAERCTEYMLGMVYTVIDGRYKSGKPMVITTNIQLADIYHPQETSPWCRIFDRITERCYPIEFTEASRRRSKAALMRRAMEERLGVR